MRRIIRLSGLAILITAILIFALTGAVLAGNGYMDSAPNAGDGIPDGSGFNGDVGAGRGPAPNAGDGIPDGSGFND